jgi:hypothetical protein
MAKSRSESPLRGAFPHLLLRGAEGDEAISRIRQGGEKSAWPGHELSAKSQALNPKNRFRV